MILPVYPDPDCVASVAKLNARERDAIILASKGLTGREVAERLHMAVSTFDITMIRARKKLDVDTTIEAAVMLCKAGLL
jgi:DNA-binding NarL/FixJ family response regulator